MKIRFISLFALCLTIFVLSANMTAAETMETRKEVDIFKRWYITFNQDVAYEQLSQFIYVTDEEGNKLETVEIQDGYYSNKLIVHPPKGGYELNKNYTLHIKEGLKSADGAPLKEDVLLPFVTREKEMETNNDKSDFIKIKSITPNTTTYTIKPGQKHDFEVVVEYGLFSAEKADLIFDWFAGDKSDHSIDGNMAEIARTTIDKGTGTITLKGFFSPDDVYYLYRSLSLGFHTANPYVSMRDWDTNDLILDITIHAPVLVGSDEDE